MLTAWVELRLIAVLRKIARGLEEANRLERHRQEIEHVPIKDTKAPAKKMVITRPTVESWNARAAGVPERER